MALRIALARDFTPNADGDYYLYDAAGLPSYLSLVRGKAWRELAPKDYRINSNVLVCTLPAVSAAANGVTYVAEWDDTDEPVAYCRFWRVLSVRQQSGKLIAELSPDDFANGIASARFDWFRATRCNKKVSEVGFYDAPLSVKAGQYYGDVVFKPSELSVVFLCSLVTSGTLIVGQSQSVSTNFLLYLPISKLVGYTPADDGYYSLALALQNIGTLYAWNAGTGIFTADQDAKLLKAWIVPTAWIGAHAFEPNDAVLKFKRVAAADDLNIIIAQNGGEIYPGVFEQYIPFPTAWKGKEYAVKCSFGGKYKGTDVPRFVNYASRVLFRMKFDTNGVTAECVVNGQNFDLTTLFEATVSADENLKTISQTIADAVQWETGTLLGAGRGYSKKGVIGALEGLTSSYASGIAQMFDTQASTRAGTGEALTTYTALEKHYNENTKRYEYDLVGQAPLGFTVWEDWDKPEARAYNEGAVFAAYLTRDEIELLASEKTLTGKVDASTYLRGDCVVSGVPERERTAIQAAFARGIWFNVCK